MANLSNHNVEWDDARQIAFENAYTVGIESIELVNAIGRTVAEDLVAQSDLPPAHTAMMDGYAVSGQGPWKIVGEVRAGQHQSELESGCALRVSTGAHIPAHCSFVIPNEDAVIFETDVASRLPVAMGKHIRVPGDEAKSGEVILKRGNLISPAAAGLAASASIDQLTVREIPYLDILITGDELIDTGIAKPGKIRDSLSIQLPAWIKKIGGQVGQLTRVLDDASETRNAIVSCQAPIIITTGGTAHGDFDYVRRALRDLNAQLLIDEINMRPGHPTVLAKLPSGQLVACLPGNPLAALVSFLTIVAPAVARLLGQELPKLEVSSLKEDIELDRTRIVPINFVDGKVSATQFRGSAMLRGLVTAEALAVVQPGRLPNTNTVRVLRLPW